MANGRIIGSALSKVHPGALKKKLNAVHPCKPPHTRYINKQGMQRFEETLRRMDESPFRENAERFLEWRKGQS